MTYYSLGKWIVEQQQGGNNRAQYGRQIIKKLSQKLNAKYGKGFSKTNLEYARKFFITIEFQEPCSDSLLLKNPNSVWVFGITKYELSQMDKYGRDKFSMLYWIKTNDWNGSFAYAAMNPWNYSNRKRIKA